MNHPLKLTFATPFHYPIGFYGVLGVHANAFLAGAFDDVTAGNHWYDHPRLSRQMQFRSESTRWLEADWLAEWLALLRIEGADELRIHFERYDCFQQHYVLPHAMGEKGIILSAWKSGLFGRKCISSWSPALESSAARQRHEGARRAYSFPVGIPANASVACVYRTSSILASAPAVPDDAHVNIAERLDNAFARAKRDGYALTNFPDRGAARVQWALEEFAATAPVDHYHPYPLFAVDTNAEAARNLYIDAGLLRAQLGQVPQRTPAYPHDDFNHGPIYPQSDSDGTSYAFIHDALDQAGLEWLALCYRKWAGSPSASPQMRLNQRSPIDLVITDDMKEGFTKTPRPGSSD